ncbi:MAG: transcription antitermination factor NusB [Endomicrobiaceae bacterium]
MGTRRQARECSLQMLYAYDNCCMIEQDILKCFDEILPVEIPYREFAVSIFRGVCKNQQQIDKLIEQSADNWEIKRMSVIDRNIMRLATYEILYMKDTPISVIIDEAVEISKTYSNRDSSKFVNGILDKLKDERKKY